jgi:hypothetical protein
MSSKWPRSSDVWLKFCIHLSFVIRAQCPVSPNILDLEIIVVLVDGLRNILINLFSPTYCYFLQTPVVFANLPLFLPNSYCFLRPPALPFELLLFSPTSCSSLRHPVVFANLLLFLPTSYCFLRPPALPSDLLLFSPTSCSSLRPSVIFSDLLLFPPTSCYFLRHLQSPCAHSFSPYSAHYTFI